MAHNHGYSGSNPLPARIYVSQSVNLVNHWFWVSVMSVQIGPGRPFHSIKLNEKYINIKYEIVYNVIRELLAYIAL